MATYKFTIFPDPERRNRIKIITNQTFGRLHVIGFAGIDSHLPRKQAMWHCLCQCGNGITASGRELRSQRIKSCGCLHNEGPQPIHGESITGQVTPEYRAFMNAKDRCNNPNDKSYPQYGGRGIKFLFTAYQDFLNEIGRKPTPRHSLERILNNGNYETGNVMWATKREQARNRRSNHWITAFNKTQILDDWTQEYGRNRHSIYGRLQDGWCAECAISIPEHSGTCPHKPQ